MTYFDLSLSNSRKYYDLRRWDGHDSTLVQHLAAIYPRALVKALELSKGHVLCNFVPKSLRVMCGHGLSATIKRGMQCSTFGFGKFRGLSVKKVLKREPDYLKWFYNEVDPYPRGYDPRDGKFDESVVEMKGWIIYYLPELAGDVDGGDLFTSFHLRDAKLRNPRRTPKSDQEAEPLDPKLKERLRQILSKLPSDHPNHPNRTEQPE